MSDVKKFRPPYGVPGVCVECGLAGQVVELPIREGLRGVALCAGCLHPSHVGTRAGKVRGKANLDIRACDVAHEHRRYEVGFTHLRISDVPRELQDYVNLSEWKVERVEKQR